ncbi:hypothetical protein AZI87_11985 [Bdellovibrio bacteriovorus]|uniref:Uncharacterized protein n=1 Tax=Bdellovibrio bacteriovorus TaxID=959 RepID=A0A161PS17_BDEBC|nr:hypothetical protein [Bdellovibrio bacteriovorus]KYG65268.1 hypothetical protein AZI87_11985 [Bdellovibrio bacteriovorus]
MPEFSQDLLDMLVSDMKARKAAAVSDNELNRQNQGFRVKIDLSAARAENNPLAVDFPFKSVFVENATDASVQVYLRATSKEDHQTAFLFKMRDSWTIEYQVPRAYLHWAAQPGKTATLVFFPDSEFRSGSQLSVTSGGVSVSDGSVVNTPVSVTLAAGVAAVIVPQNLDRKVALIENKTGSDIWIGGPAVSNAGANEGIRIASGERLEYRNTGDLYGYSVGGGKVTRVEET